MRTRALQVAVDWLFSSSLGIVVETTGDMFAQPSQRCTICLANVGVRVQWGSPGVQSSEGATRFTLQLQVRIGDESCTNITSVNVSTMSEHPQQLLVIRKM